MNLGLVYSALVENNNQAIEELDDVFEENGLERCKNKYKLYFSLTKSIEVTYFLNTNKPEIKYFNSSQERECFISGMHYMKMYSDSELDFWFIYGFSLSEYKDKHKKFNNEVDKNIGE